jgi:hypothetical protein
MCINIGNNGMASNGEAFADSNLGQRVKKNTLNTLPDHVIIVDEAFPLKPYLMKLYSSCSGLDDV